MKCKTARQYIQLDLDGELPTQGRIGLEEHLKTCRDCREIRGHFTTIQSAMCQLSAIDSPAAQIPASVDFGEYRTTPWPAGLAVAAVIALCIGGGIFLNALRSEAPVQTLLVQKQPEPTMKSEQNPKPLVRVEFDPAAEVIAVPIETKNPNVTIIWVYPTIKTARASLQSVNEPPSPS